MGINWSSEAPSRIIMLGLDAAGKTTLLYKLKSGDVVTTIPTIGFNVETLTLSRKTELVSWDVGGRCASRPLWRHYFKGAQALVFVVDSSDRDRMDEAAEELARALILMRDELRDCPLLVLANKTDLPNAMQPAEIAEALRLAQLDRHRPLRLFPISANSFEGANEAFEWLAREVKRLPTSANEDAVKADAGTNKLHQLTQSLLPKGLHKLLFS